MGDGTLWEHEFGDFRELLETILASVLETGRQPIRN